MSKKKLDIKLIKSFLKSRLQTDYVTFYGHQSEWKNLNDLLKRTAENGESNSALLIGPRGCGKTTLISSVLNSLLPQEDFYKNTLVVHLNGLIHTDDRLALKSATLQLKLENAVDGKVFGSFAENLSFLLDCLKTGDKNRSKSIIFILEEFDLFCTHHNQTLLYNLFDVSQSAQTPICVLGITCRLDVIELLEKRVKSRFSHRQIFLFEENSDFQSRLQICNDLLLLPSVKKLNKTQPTKSNLLGIDNSELVFLLRTFDCTKYQISKEDRNAWNNHINELMLNGIVISAFKSIFEIDSTVSFLKMFLFKVISQLSEDQMYLDPQHIENIILSYDEDSKVQLLGDVSVLELCLIIAIKHHSEIYDGDHFNFEIIFNRFLKFSKTSSSLQGIQRAVILKAFEHLKNLEFIVPANSNANKIQKEFQMHKLLLTYGEIKQAISKYHTLPTEVLQWSQSNLL